MRGKCLHLAERIKILFFWIGSDLFSGQIYTVCRLPSHNFPRALFTFRTCCFLQISIHWRLPEDGHGSAPRVRGHVRPLVEVLREEPPVCGRGQSSVKTLWQAQVTCSHFSPHCLKYGNLNWLKDPFIPNCLAPFCELIKCVFVHHKFATDKTTQYKTCTEFHL